MQLPQTSYRSCNLCEAICGLEIEHDGHHVLSIKGDKNDPLSQGHICPKAVALQDIHSDPDRLRLPVRRTRNGFEPISWDDAFDLVESKVRDVRQTYGNDAIALYLGNPTVHHSGALLFQKYLKQSLQTRNCYSASSVDQLPHHFAASMMFGHSLLVPVPDIDNTNFMLILGANPAVSNGSLMTAPDVRNRLKRITKRGGSVVLLDPRQTATSKLATDHFFIRPGTDIYFLAAVLHVLFQKQPECKGRLGEFTRNIEILQQAVAKHTPELASQITGVPAAVIRELAEKFSSAQRAVVYGRMGVSTQTHGTLCHWLINAINLVTGNLDRTGGQMFSQPAIPLVGKSGTTSKYARWHSRVRWLPEFEGEFPVSTLAEEMLAAGDGQIRALITNAGNPVLSTPNGKKLERAIAQLDFYVALDIYVNETTRHADLILPSPTGLETNHYDFIFNTLAVRNVVKYSQQVFQPEPGTKYDWQIMKELALRLMPVKAGMANTAKRWMRRKLLRWLTPERMVDIGLRFGPYGILRKGLSLKRLTKSPHGIDLGPLSSVLPKQLRTPDRKIDAAPAVFVEPFSVLTRNLLSAAATSSSIGPPQFKLIGRRHLRSNNSWMHNAPRLMKGGNRCTLLMNCEDAKRLDLQDEQIVSVASSVGSIEIPLETTDSIMPGVVSLPHGYGHHREGTRLRVAEEHSGVSINDITDESIVDPISGNAAFSGQIVSVTASAR